LSPIQPLSPIVRRAALRQLAPGWAPSIRHHNEGDPRSSAARWASLCLEPIPVVGDRCDPRARADTITQLHVTFCNVDSLRPCPRSLSLRWYSDFRSSCAMTLPRIIPARLCRIAMTGARQTASEVAWVHGQVSVTLVCHWRTAARSVDTSHRPDIHARPGDGRHRLRAYCSSRTTQSLSYSDGTTDCFGGALS
jgi:hypothetical protein